MASRGQYNEGDSMMRLRLSCFAGYALAALGKALTNCIGPAAMSPRGWVKELMADLGPHFSAKNSAAYSFKHPRR